MASFKQIARFALPVLVLLTVGQPAPAATDEETGRIVHVLNRLAYGPRPGEVERVRAIGVDRWIERQLVPASIPDPGVERRLRELPTVSMTTLELLRAYPPPQIMRSIAGRMERQLGSTEAEIARVFPELDGKAPAGGGPGRIARELVQARLTRAVYSERALEQVMTEFWFDHFNVFIGKGLGRWFTASYEREAIRPHALGRFRDLLGATASHPAMLTYLDNWTNTAEGVRFGQREMRYHAARSHQRHDHPPGGLFTLILRDRGVDTSPIDPRLERWQRDALRQGPAGPDGFEPAGKHGQRSRLRGPNENYARELLELHTLGVDGGYTQEDVVSVARCFSGWTLVSLDAGREFRFIEALHDPGPHRLLGRKVPGQGRAQGEAVLDRLASHPATARFISEKLARRFVADEPPAELVRRMARTFLESDGDIGAVLRVMFRSEAFWAPEHRAAKVKRPFELVVSALRATGAELTSTAAARGESARPGMDPDASRPRPGVGLLAVLRQLGHSPYGARPPTGFDDRAEAWLSTGALLNRMKFSFRLAADRIDGVRLPAGGFGRNGMSGERWVAELGRELYGRSPDTTTVEQLGRRLETRRSIWRRGLEPQAGRTLALGWLLAAPEFQRR